MQNQEIITLFGATGFIGRHVVRLLAKTGARIHIACRDPNDALLLKPMGDIGQIVPVRVNIRDDASIAAAIQNSTTVINLIGILYESGKNTFQAIHVEAAARIARIAKERGATHFVQMSALGANPGSLSAYARSKAAGEQAVRTFFPDATIIRPSIVFGAEDNFFNKFSAMAGIAPALPLIGGGHTKFQPVFVGDVAEAVRTIVENPTTKGQIYEFGGPTVYTFRQLLELMLKLTNRKRCLISLSWTVAKIQATLFELLPVPPLTRDQVDLLRTDNIINAAKNPNSKTLKDLGVQATPLEAVLPTYINPKFYTN